ncbi:nuclear transport factor 2 family protein [Aquibium sp. LZ166]|uniref:Nuclear transport factor 2 family protein n=1 Tax=Aquibium pacificus TaxID=3153579 RepID=A0ABV3SEL9_9HYPH
MPDQSSVEDPLRWLADKDAIRDAMYRYARGVDRLDPDLIRSAYHSDAHDDHGSYKGDVDGLIEWIMRRHASIDQSMHLIANTLIEFLSNDVAVMESYVIVPQSYPAEARETIRAWVGEEELNKGERLAVVMYARMIDRFERRAGEWKIANRVVVIEEVDAKRVPVRNGPPVSVAHVRGPGDPLYGMLK